MSIRRLRVQGIRNLLDVDVELARVNVLFGANGSGKTSLLESVYVLGSGKSFRAPRLDPVISHQAEECVVHASLVDANGVSTPMGLARQRSGDLQGRIQGRTVQNAAELARSLPLQLINSDTFQLLEGGPKNRRQFLDWGVFHVEHGFHAVWLDVQRALRQRNALLRHAKLAPDQLEAWDIHLSARAEELDAFRRAYFDTFYPRFVSTLRELASLDEVDLAYQRGWDKDTPLRDVLREGLLRDHERGFTVQGPHRADIRVRVRGQSAEQVLSRGQQKLVVCAMKVAQARVFSASRQRDCVFLVDDLPAELDHAHRASLTAVLSSLGCQVLVSCVDRRDLESTWPSVPEEQKRMFHVEQGRFTQVSWHT
jgi:DNA replication and repair protein RecF